MQDPELRIEPAKPMPPTVSPTVPHPQYHHAWSNIINTDTSFCLANISYNRRRLEIAGRQISV